MLIDQELRLKFFNGRFVEFQRYPPELARPGVHARDMLRFMVARDTNRVAMMAA